MIAVRIRVPGARYISPRPSGPRARSFIIIIYENIIISHTFLTFSDEPTREKENERKNKHRTSNIKMYMHAVVLLL